jgi:hypothetical protein
MKMSMNEPNKRTFVIEDREWFDRMVIGEKAEEIIAWKLAETFTKEELRKLIKVDMKKVEKKVIEKIAEKVVDRCLKSEALRGQELKEEE